MRRTLTLTLAGTYLAGTFVAPASAAVAAPPAPAPSAYRPLNLQITTKTHNQKESDFFLTWEPPQRGTRRTQYQVQESNTPSGGWRTVATRGGLDWSYLSKTVPPGTQRCYRVGALFRTVGGKRRHLAWTPPKCANTLVQLVPPVTLSAPDLLDLKFLTDPRPEILEATWKDTEGEDGYKVRVFGSSDPTRLRNERELKLKQFEDPVVRVGRNETKYRFEYRPDMLEVCVGVSAFDTEGVSNETDTCTSTGITPWWAPWP